MKKYIRNGKYNASPCDFIYYENGNNNFTARENGNGVEVYYGANSGGGEYYDLPISAKKDLLKICGYCTYNTRALTNYARKNDINRKEETKNGLGVKMSLVGKDGNAYSLISLFRQKALKQDIDKVKVEEVITNAKSKDYSHLIYTLTSNCN